MKKLLILSILTYLLFIINSSAVEVSSSNAVLKNEKILKIGILLPLSGEHQILGQSFLKAIQLALKDISNKNIIIYPKDTKGNSLTALKAAKEFEKNGIKIVIGPIFHESLEMLDEIDNITFISFTNKTIDIPKNIIAFGVNIESQMEALKKYFDEIKVSKTLLLSPKSEFIYQSESVAKKDILKFYRTYSYDANPKKITGEIKKITKYKERKKDLERRIKILEKSDLYKDKKELKKLEQKHTLGKVNFFTINQWFDETFFSEIAMQNLHFPSIDLKNLESFNKKYFNTYNETPNKVSILAYDAIGLIYYCWYNNKHNFKISQLYNKEGFKGLHGEFIIINNLSRQKLKVYKVSKKKFERVY